MTPDQARKSAVIGKAVNRVDGRLKVTGKATYAAEWKLDELAYGFPIQSSVARGKITSIDTAAAEQLHGVLAVYSHAAKPLEIAGENKPQADRLFLMQDNEIHYAGQIIALVVAQSFEVARQAATLVKITYEPADFCTSIKTQTDKSYPIDSAPDEERGNFQKAFDAAPIKLEATYTTPVENHNPMEPFACIADWQNDMLTVYDSTQAVIDSRSTIAGVLGLPADKVHVISPFVGGGFGSKLTVWSHIPLAAGASRKLGRPVKIVVARSQMYGPFGCRPSTIQTVKIGSTKEGKFEAICHEGVNSTARFIDFIECVGDSARQMYACENTRTSHRLVQLDMGEATWMRAPGHATGSFALECAIDELAEKLNIDPIELRLANFAEKDFSSNLPWSSNNLRECYKRGAATFGWDKRPQKPGSLKSGKSLVGYGMAAAFHQMEHNPASARTILSADGRAVVETASHDIGTGTYTIMSQIAAEVLTLPLELVTLKLGDSSLPPSPMSGGSTTAGCVGSAVAKACEAAIAKLKELATGNAQSALYQAKAQDLIVSSGCLQPKDDPSKGESFQTIISRTGKSIDVTIDSKPGSELQRYSACEFGAVFAEVHVDPEIGRIKVPRLVGAYDIGRVLNPKTARSQVMGGMIFGIGMALMEHTWIDQNFGRVINADIAEYHVPVHPDMGEMLIELIDTDDPYVNQLGVKGAGEIGITGVAAAIANAVYNASGLRIRDLPITLDYLM